MKKLLILAYDFPPYVSVGGLRPYNWFKYLREFGIEPVVITRQWQNEYGNELDYVSAGYSDNDVIEESEYGTIIYTPYKPNLANRLLLKYGEQKYRLPRKLITAFFEFTQFLFTIGPKSELFRGARQYMKNNKVDAIIATGDPFTLFSYAQKLGSEFDVPWIADYRDPWSQTVPTNQIIFKRWSKFFERKLLKSARAITTVSPFVENLIKEHNSHTPIFIIPNGYDPELIDEMSNLPQNRDCLTLGHAGTINNWNPIELFLRTLHETYLSEQLKFRLNFYGTNNQQELEELIQTKYPEIMPFIHFYLRMPNVELLSNLASDNVLLLFNYYSFMGTKIYDYLGMKRQILFCFTNDIEAEELRAQHYIVTEDLSPNDSLQANLIRKTNSGILVENTQQLKNELIKLETEFNLNKRIKCESVDTERFSRKKHTETLAKHIMELTN